MDRENCFVQFMVCLFCRLRRSRSSQLTFRSAGYWRFSSTRSTRFGGTSRTIGDYRFSFPRAGPLKPLFNLPISSYRDTLHCLRLLKLDLNLLHSILELVRLFLRLLLVPLQLLLPPLRRYTLLQPHHLVRRGIHELSRQLNHRTFLTLSSDRFSSSQIQRFITSRSRSIYS